MDVWLIEPPAAVKAAAAGVQAVFSGLGWIEPVPSHFLHVLVSHDADFLGLESTFEVSYGRANCFHDAVVAEVAADALSSLRRDEFCLPHLTLGYFRRSASARELGVRLEPLREAELGTQLVDELLLCRVPLSRKTFLQPWTVLRRLPLRR